MHGSYSVTKGSGVGTTHVCCTTPRINNHFQDPCCFVGDADISKYVTYIFILLFAIPFKFCSLSSISKRKAQREWRMTLHTMPQAPCTVLSSPMVVSKLTYCVRNELDYPSVSAGVLASVQENGRSYHSYKDGSESKTHPCYFVDDEKLD